jgi:hypothetical protein
VSHIARIITPQQQTNIHTKWPPVLTSNRPEVDSRSPGRDLNPESPEHEAGAVPTGSRSSVCKYLKTSASIYECHWSNSTEKRVDTFGKKGNFDKTEINTLRKTVP